MKSFILLLMLIVTTSSLTSKDNDGGLFSFPNDIRVSAENLRAMTIAIDALRSRSDYNSEQRDIRNYYMLVYKVDALVEVAFIAIARKGDEEVIGGNHPYAKSCSYFIDATNMKIIRVQSSK